MLKNRSNAWPTVLALSFLPLLGSIYYLQRYAVMDIPMMDDFTYTTAFIFPFEAAQGLWAKWKVLFVQHFVTEHRIPLGKLVIYALYRLNHREVDFVTLAWSGNVCIVGVVALLGAVYRKTRRSAWLFLPVPVVVFQVQHYELFVWSNCSLLYVPVVFFALSSAYFLIYHRNYSPGRLVLAFVFTVLCMYTFGNGMFVFATNAVILAYQNRFRTLAVMLALAAFCVLTYFVDYRAEYATQWTVTMPLSLAGLLGAWLHPLSALGNSLRYLTVALGLGVVAVLAVQGWRLVGVKIREWLPALGVRWAKPTPGVDTPGVSTPGVSTEEFFLSIALLFMFMTATAVALKRSGLGFDEMFVSRYRYLGVLAVAVGYLLLVLKMRDSPKKALTLSQKTRLGAVLGFALFIHLLSYYAYHAAIFNHREQYFVGAYDYRRAQNWYLFPQDNFWTRYVNQNTAIALRTGLYHFPELFYSDLETQLEQTDTTRRVSLPLEVREAPDAYTLVNTTLRPTQNSLPNGEGTCLLLRGAGGVILAPIERQPNRGRKDLLRTGRLFGSGFMARLVKGTYPPGHYRVGLLHRQGGQLQLGYTGLVLSL